MSRSCAREPPTHSVTSAQVKGERPREAQYQEEAHSSLYKNKRRGTTQARRDTSARSKEPPTTRCREQIQSNAEKASNLQPTRKASLQGSRYSTCVRYTLFCCLVSCPLSQGSFPETAGLLARCMAIVPRLRPRHVTSLAHPRGGEPGHRPCRGRLVATSAMLCVCDIHILGGRPSGKLW